MTRRRLNRRQLNQRRLNGRQLDRQALDRRPLGRPGRLVGAAAAVALVVGALSGCAASGYSSDTEATLESRVLAVSEASAAGDYPTAVARLDELTADTDAALSRGEVGEDRHAEITAAIALVRTELDGLAAEAARVAEEQRVAEEARRAEEARLAEEARRAEEQRLAEEQRNADENENENESENNGNGNGNGPDREKKNEED